jgi:hypothetical protein
MGERGTPSYVYRLDNANDARSAPPWAPTVSVKEEPLGD